MNDINSEIKSIDDSLTTTNEIADNCRKNEQDTVTIYCTKIIEFESEAKKTYEKLQRVIKLLNIEYTTVQSYYGEKMDLDDFLKACKEFHAAYEKVRKENEASIKSNKM